MAEDYTTRTPGQILRARREDRDFSLHDAEEGTKIPKHLLESIERDEYHKLSGPIYVKSFLRNYSGWLGLDAEEILAVYELATGRPEMTTGVDDEVWSEDQVAVTRVGMAWTRLVVIAVAATVVLVGLVLVLLNIFSGGGGETAGPAPTTALVVPEKQTIVTRAEADSVVDTDPAVPEPQTRTGVRSETQPTQHDESSAERLARLTEGEIGGLPEETQPPPATASVEDASDTTPEPAASTPTRELSPPRRGDPELRFTGGEVYPLVLRVLLPEPVNCTVRRDDQPDAVPVIWPDDPGPPPAYNLRHGLAYAVRDGYAIYWGAEDHFTLTLGRIDAAEVTLNGHAQSLADWRPGQTKLLDAARLPRDGG